MARDIPVRAAAYNYKIIKAAWIQNGEQVTTKVNKFYKSLKNKRPTWCHLLFYFTSYVLNMFRILIYPKHAEYIRSEIK